MTYKSIKTLVSISSFIALASSTYAVNYFLSSDQISTYGADLKLSQSLSFVDSTGATQYFWYTLVSDGTTKNWCTELPDFTNTSSVFNIGCASSTASGKINYTVDVLRLKEYLRIG